MTFLISYPLSLQSPLYPGTPPFSCQNVKSLTKGDRANTSLLILSSHSGSHIDAPRHFCTGGKTTKEILGTQLDLSPVYCIDVAVGKDTPIRISDVQSIIGEIPDAQGLLIRTGMFRFRTTDPEKYCSGHPWVHPELPEYLKCSCPKLQLFGTDTISISNPLYRDDGRVCHRAFLCGDSPVMLAEDLDLSDPSLTSAPLEVVIHPLIVDDLDGVPVLAFAKFVAGRPRGGFQTTMREL